jgi:hypothetical protein
MKRTLRLLTLLPVILLFGTFAIGQNLTPQELIQINSSTDPAISNILSDKGFKKREGNDFDQSTKETKSSWYFQPFFNHSGEHESSNVIKSVDSIQKTKTVFLLYNPFHYKEFIQNLVKSKYRFTGIQMMYSKVYAVFENEGAVFMTTERLEPDGKSVFSIIVKVK